MTALAIIPIPIDLEEEKLRQRFRRSLLAILSIPCMAFFVLLFLGAILSGFDSYHDQTVHSWDMLRIFAIALMTEGSALIIGLASFRWVRKIVAIGWLRSFILIGFVYSILSASLNYLIWQCIEAFLYFKVVLPNHLNGPFAFLPSSLPLSVPKFSLSDFLYLTAIFSLFCIPTALFACIYTIRKAPKLLTQNHQSA